MTADKHRAPRVTRERFGRKRDPSLDGAILDATLEILAEVGSNGLTMDLVAARARAGKATMYRRWSSKTELVVDAVAHMKRRHVDLDHLPDTGTLRGDLLSLLKPRSPRETERMLKTMTALVSLLGQDRTIADTASAAMIEPWVEAQTVLMRRAAARGEISASTDIPTLAQVIPSLATYRTLVQRRPVDLAFATSMIDVVLGPALGLKRVDEPANPAVRKPQKKR